MESPSSNGKQSNNLKWIKWKISTFPKQDPAVFVSRIPVEISRQKILLKKVKKKKSKTNEIRGDHKTSLWSGHSSSRQKPNLSVQCTFTIQHTWFWQFLFHCIRYRKVTSTKVPILQVVISFRMKLWPVASFFSLTFGIGKHTKHCSMSFPYSSTRNDAAMFCMFPDSKSEWKKGATSQSFIRKEIMY